MNRQHHDEMPIDPPESSRRIVTYCADCGEPIRVEEEIVYSSDLSESFCETACFESYMGVEKRVFPEF